ncbi:unnamed protein product [Symbiodinium natans]|uniref:Uncharacterized protein n=1 Tax=Symbiodinium natans TaxID=878477 RepID=A0A812GCI2_9DINO|nr:unnamed protein product [Symbiodinium natans]
MAIGQGFEDRHEVPWALLHGAAAAADTRRAVESAEGEKWNMSEHRRASRSLQGNSKSDGTQTWRCALFGLQMVPVTKAPLRECRSIQGLLGRSFGVSGG